MAVIGVLTLELHIEQSHSLKDKRQVLRSLKDRLRRLNVAVSELEFHDAWQRSVVGVVTISAEKKRVEQVLTRVEEEAALTLGASLTASHSDYF